MDGLGSLDSTRRMARAGGFLWLWRRPRQPVTTLPSAPMSSVPMPTLPTLPMHHRLQPFPPHGVRGPPARLVASCACCAYLQSSRGQINATAPFVDCPISSRTVGDGWVCGRGTRDAALPFCFNIPLRILWPNYGLGLMALAGHPAFNAALNLPRNRLLSSDPPPPLPLPLPLLSFAYYIDLGL